MDFSSLVVFLGGQCASRHRSTRASVGNQTRTSLAGMRRCVEMLMDQVRLGGPATTLHHGEIFGILYPPSGGDRCSGESLWRWKAPVFVRLDCGLVVMKKYTRQDLSTSNM
ncbi:hypothetical protein CC2G_014025 [Coprinopsis cinerea AmutBmut pab1-1]|nr:hypothetical protein CC2G_014025 [Coprinopsis cinerea AmutBmut pab1-1]